MLLGRVYAKQSLSDMVVVATVNDSGASRWQQSTSARPALVVMTTRALRVKALKYVQARVMGRLFAARPLRFVVCLPRGSDNEVSVDVNKPNS